ncbi:Rad9/DDC1 [Penicillium maclennaniae]|uniref:Rad9/DDC1 n=1 Tax=Penicillium maclennaniae TaxID=1343394 RepID=UPI0025401F32|nr:Rad9/DDC1 [Penicillium maclennaniae]KAJ5666211.1 Rad9/DDC1 [Penicillium maclennaniae]
MPSLKLSLGPPALVRLHDILICLSKFSDTVAIEAEHDLLRLSALNSTKTAFASFVCEKELFFEAYSFDARKAIRSPSSTTAGDRFYCQILLKALLSVFRGRVDRNKDAAVERCDMELHEDPQETECRLTIKMICGLGVIKSYKLTYEPASIQHAVFDRSRATNQWTADPRFLKQIIEHFSLSAEQLDIYSDSGKAVFTSFTTKITDGKEVLKCPVHTSVAADKRDFEEIQIEDNMHIAINLKDFKAVVAHAETTNATVTARYTQPCKPLQLAYDFDGVNAEFTIMTRGEVEGETAPASSRAGMPQLSQRQTPALISLNRAQTPRGVTQSTQMPPPPPPARGRSVRPLNGSSTSTQDRLAPTAVSDRPSASSLSTDFDSLFVPADDDRQWDEMDEQEEPQDILGWDASGRQDNSEPTLQEAEPDFPKLADTRRRPPNDDMGVPPTQRMSQVRGLGLFD